MTELSNYAYVSCVLNNSVTTNEAIINFDFLEHTIRDKDYLIDAWKTFVTIIRPLSQSWRETEKCHDNSYFVFMSIFVPILFAFVKN